MNTDRDHVTAQHLPDTVRNLIHVYEIWRVLDALSRYAKAKAEEEDDEGLAEDYAELSGKLKLLSKYWK